VPKSHATALKDIVRSLGGLMRRGTVEMIRIAKTLLACVLEESVLATRSRTFLSMKSAEPVSLNRRDKKKLILQDIAAIFKYYSTF